MFNSPLKMNKLGLVNFTLLSEKAVRANTLVLTQSTGSSQITHQIQASPQAKLLGILFNSKLTWKVHHEKVCKKAIKWTMALKCFTKVAVGIRMNEACKLYNAVAVPKITYAADLWFCPKISHKTD